MSAKSPDALLALILIVVSAAVGLIAWDANRRDPKLDRSRELQQLVRGIGLGPALTLSRCEFSFDPRVFSDWRTAHDPVLCGELFCPGHASSVFDIAPLDRQPFPGGSANASDR